MKAIKIDTRNNMSVVDLETPLYASLERELGGWPEHVRPRRLNPPFCMMVDDCGHMKELDFNLMGSYLYETDKHGNPIAGDIFILKEEVYASGEYNVIGLDDKDVNFLSDWILTTMGKAIKAVT